MPPALFSCSGSCIDRCTASCHNSMCWKHCSAADCNMGQSCYEICATGQGGSGWCAGDCSNTTCSGGCQTSCNVHCRSPTRAGCSGGCSGKRKIKKVT